MLSKPLLHVAVGKACAHAGKARRRHGECPWLAACPTVLRGLLKTIRAVNGLPLGIPLLPGSRPRGAGAGCGALGIAPCHGVRVPRRCQGACCLPEWGWRFCREEAGITSCLLMLHTLPASNKMSRTAHPASDAIVKRLSCNSLDAYMQCRFR